VRILLLYWIWLIILEMDQNPWSSVVPHVLASAPLYRQSAVVSAPSLRACPFSTQGYALRVTHSFLY